MVRRKYYPGWLCYFVVKTWRPLYRTWNEHFARADRFIELIILDEDTFQRWQRKYEIY